MPPAAPTDQRSWPHPARPDGVFGWGAGWRSLPGGDVLAANPPIRLAILLDLIDRAHLLGWLCLGAPWGIVISSNGSDWSAGASKDASDGLLGEGSAGTGSDSSVLPTLDDSISENHPKVPARRDSARPGLVGLGAGVRRPLRAAADSPCNGGVILSWPDAAIRSSRQLSARGHNIDFGLLAEDADIDHTTSANPCTSWAGVGQSGPGRRPAAAGRGGGLGGPLPQRQEETGQELLCVRRGDGHVHLSDGQGDALIGRPRSTTSRRGRMPCDLRLQGLRGCPLAGECLDPKATRGRTISRDGHEPASESGYAKMQSESGSRTYHRRMHIGETPFAIIKSIFCGAAVRAAGPGEGADGVVPGVRPTI